MSSSNCKKRRVHVAVQLSGSTKDSLHSDNNNNNRSTTNNSSTNILTPPSLIAHAVNFYQSVEILDSQTLNLKSLNGVDYKLNFDHVTTASDNELNSQVCNLLDELLLERQNCCLLLFESQRNVSSLIQMFKLLIAEVNRRIERLEASISSINLIYMDNEDEAGSEEEAMCLHFTGTAELFKWLMDVYRLTRRSISKVHESLVLKFVIKPVSSGNLYQVKLSVFNLYFTQLDDVMKDKLLAYIMQPEQIDVFSHTILTALLRDHMEADASKLLLCNIPSDICSNAVSLLINIAIYIFVRYKEENLCSRKGSLPNMPLTSTTVENHSETPTTSVPRPRPVSFNIPFKDKAIKKTRLAQVFYGNKDLSKLRTWYIKLDERFDEARTLIEHYYARKYDIKTKQICADIATMSRTIDFVHNSLKLETHTIDDDANDVSLEDIHNEYKTTMQNLQDEVDNSGYADDLKVYMSTKQFSHSQQILSFKLKQLGYCKQRLNETMDEELAILSGAIYEDED